MNRWLSGSIVAVVVLLLAPAASAHLALTYPAPRDAALKQGPCGTTGSVRGSKVTTFKPGEKITVTWTETVDHPGHFRISFDDDGNDSFVDPKGYDDLNTAPSVMVDNIADKTGSMQMYSQEITLPNKECSNCTLQVLQLMSDKPPFGDGNEFYYQCADIVISGAPAGSSSSSSAAAGGGDGPSGESGGGCALSADEGGGGSLAALSLLALIGLARSRRAR
jgi:predicted carbohydrate-binding protein with CBM5 and CBM33 domain